MKKLVPLILIAIIFVQLLAPFSVGSGEKNDPIVRINTAEAVGETLIVSVNPKTSGTLSVEINGLFTTAEKMDLATVIYTIGLNPNTYSGDSVKEVALKNYSYTENLVGEQTVYTYKIGWLADGFSNNGDITDFEKGNTYYARLIILKNDGSNLKFESASKEFVVGTSSTTGNAVTDEEKAAAQAAYDQIIAGGGTKEEATIAANNAVWNIQEKNRGEASKPYNIVDSIECTLFRSSTWLGCLGKLLYWGIYGPTSHILALTGRLLDVTIGYSVMDTSYRSAFVTEGWGVVRDLCNMFFIFVMLYIAIGTILNLHSVKTKEMIINVIIIGLLINFSLFATQIIIDASNILTRVFYNPQTIIVGPKDNSGTVHGSLGTQGEIKLSEAIMSKTNPASLLLDAKDAGTIQTKYTTVDSGDTLVDNQISGKTFLLVTILTIVINVVGIITFLSCSLIFISRVVGLWIAMIFAPLAFFSYTIPALQDMEMIGWKKWWPSTLKMAFLAPIFVFFLYLIVKFLDTDLGLKINDSKGGLDFLLGIFVPFTFLMILLNKAKKIASDMSGELGQSITKGLSTAGGMALGAGIGGAALLGRASLGRVANKIGNNKWINDSASGKNGKFSQFIGKGLKGGADYTSKSSFDFRQTGVGNAFSKEMGMDLNKGTNYLGLDTKKGLDGYVGSQKRKVEKENKFGESLGYDHHKYEEIGDEIAEKEKALADYKASGIDHNTTEYKRSVAEQENEITGKKKEQERVKTGRAKEYALTNKRKSGKIYDIDRFRDVSEEKVQELEDKYNRETDPKKKEKARIEYEKAFNSHVDPNIYRDKNGNIKKFGRANSAGMQGAKQIMKEFAAGVAKGAGTGALVGTIVPGIGTLTGAGIGTLAGAIRGLINAVNYSGTTNRKVGEESHGDKHETPDKYKPGSAPSHTPSGSSTAPTTGGTAGGHGGHH
jgi:hypothetical protein